MRGIREQILLSTGQSFRLLRWRENVRDVELVLTAYKSVRISGEGTHWHYHPQFELTLFSSGEGTRFVGDKIQSFHEGDLVLLGENLPHYWHSRGSSSGLSIQWHFPTDHPFWSFPETSGLMPFLKSAARGIHITGRTSETIAAQLEQASKSGGMDRLGLLFRILGTLAATSAFDQTFLSLNSFSLSRESPHQNAMQATLRFLLANFRSEIRLKQVLEIARMSKPTFARQFKKHYGKTLTRFLQQLRLDAASRELVDTDEPIIDVALGCGFSEISFFNRLFLRTFKCNPTKYRLKARKCALNKPELKLVS